ncbi:MULTISPECIES: hypothetical protein [Pseudomonas]|jgi:hypothetical protein|uniref:hypothetical protein n=1 Tax=Pseudomonas TaxID=286 RepID=UPI00026E4A99|nr:MULTISPECIES: hypothetical protein [Pseudomonas]AZD03015.1 hypothetical protein C4K27_3823 [Pseudomonas chlororaphis subsp. chlororaphis]AZD16513.1 hypothetical protein C4K25_3586 [Pseudomonas chlororaphis]EJL06882.1 hypothetical protein Pchl3084_3485 [Pseudomonas chlororaphis subsp. aureofaciens 30-84]MCP1478212.1 hypothetical protein [Pseudomonas chlororaphis]MCP1595436.1 hypothetical protein [Pseudomonas chlororaphis]
MYITRATILRLSAALSIMSFDAQAQEPNAYQLFDPVVSVLQSPRCMNCHQSARPTQKDSMIAHIQNVVRGTAGLGAPTMQCIACHQEKNTADGKVPGARGWHMPPLPMVWEGLTSAQICHQMQDPKRNGNRKTPEEVIEHMRTDPLVLWAWDPGAGRSTPSITHDQFIERLELWAKAGMPCPDEQAAAR